MGEQIGQPGNLGVQKALWGLLILVLIGVVGAGLWALILHRPASKRALSVGSRQPPAYGSVPLFSFMERSGQRVERAEFLGRIWVVDLIYTHCPDTCPLQSAEMARLQAELVNETDMRLVSITVDPARDTLAVLSRYAKRFGADPKRWLFLTGEKEAIYRFVQEGLRLPVMDPRRRARGAGGEGVSFLHSSRFVLVDREARIRGYYESSDMESLRQLREDVKTLLRKE